MGKRIIPRARGAGGPRYIAPSHRYLGKVEYFAPGNGTYKVVDITHDPGHSVPVAVVKSTDGKEIFQVATEGIMVGDNVVYGGDVYKGNVVHLSEVPEGTKVFGIETKLGSGPRMCRSSGTFATVLGKSGKKVSVQFTSGRIMELDPDVRATVGIAAGGGRKDKPWLKVGKQYFAKHARGKIFPRSAGVAQTPTDHPYGGKQHRPRPSRTVGRTAPPGAKVGSIAARRVGKRKK